MKICVPAPVFTIDRAAVPLPITDEVVKLEPEATASVRVETESKFTGLKAPLPVRPPSVRAVRLPAAVPVWSVPRPSVLNGLDCRATELVTISVPPSTRVRPMKVFVAESVRLPAFVLMRPPAPETTPPSVAADRSATSNVVVNGSEAAPVNAMPPVPEPVMLLPRTNESVVFEPPIVSCESDCVVFAVPEVTRSATSVMLPLATRRE